MVLGLLCRARRVREGSISRQQALEGRCWFTCGSEWMGRDGGHV
jgi:hypothetical protein